MTLPDPAPPAPYTMYKMDVLGNTGFDIAAAPSYVNSFTVNQLNIIPLGNGVTESKTGRLVELYVEDDNGNIIAASTRFRTGKLKHQTGVSEKSMV